jgi:hypothetical protein
MKAPLSQQVRIRLALHPQVDDAGRSTHGLRFLSSRRTVRYARVGQLHIRARSWAWRPSDLRTFTSRARSNGKSKVVVRPATCEAIWSTARVLLITALASLAHENEAPCQRNLLRIRQNEPRMAIEKVALATLASTLWNNV